MCRIRGPQLGSQHFWYEIGACLNKSAGTLREPGGFMRRHSCHKLCEFSESGDWFTDRLFRGYSPKVEYAGFV